MDAKERTWKPVAAGVLTIISGTVALGGGIAIVLVGGGLTGLQLSSWLEFLAGMPGFAVLPPLLLGSLGALLIPMGVLSVMAGIEGIKRRHWKLCLAGSLCATAVIPVFGLPATALIILSRREFAGRAASPGAPDTRERTGASKRP